ncbi:MAG: hypothetical protein R6U98_09415 [Pirellulaceae bacterium]
MFASGSLYSIVIANGLASAVNEIDAGLDERLQGERQQIKQLVLWFFSQPISPTTFAEFQQGLQNIVLRR